MTMQTTELSLTPTAAAEAVVDLDAIAHNVRLLREHRRVGPGDGRRQGRRVRPRRHPVGRAALAAGAAELGVATIDEALALRRDGISAPVLAWLHAPGTDFAPALEADVQVAVSSVRQLGELLDAVERTGRTATVTVKVDTGLNRNGVGAADYPEMLTALRRAQADGRDPAARHHVAPGARRRPGEPAQRPSGAAADRHAGAGPRPGCALEIAHLMQLARRHDPPRSGLRHGAARYRGVRADPHSGAR